MAGAAGAAAAVLVAPHHQVRLQQRGLQQRRRTDPGSTRCTEFITRPAVVVEATAVEGNLSACNPVRAALQRLLRKVRMGGVSPWGVLGAMM